MNCDDDDDGGGEPTTASELETGQTRRQWSCVVRVNPPLPRSTPTYLTPSQEAAPATCIEAWKGMQPLQMTAIARSAGVG